MSFVQSLESLFGFDYDQQMAAARKQYDERERVARIQHSFGVEATNKRNAYNLKIYNLQKQMHQQQLQWNQQFAQEAYSNAQTQFNNAVASAMLSGTAMTQQLMEAEGRVAASGSTSRSALRKESIQALGEYGRQSAILDENIYGSYKGLNRSLEAITNQWNIANQQSYANVAIAPMMEEASPYIASQFNAPQQRSIWSRTLDAGFAAAKVATPFLADPKTGAEGWGNNVIRTLGKFA